MVTGTKLKCIVISGIRHGVNDIFAFWDVKQLRLIITDVSEQQMAPYSRVQQYKVQQYNCQYILCEIPEERSTNLIEMTNKMQLCRTIYYPIVP
jgi:hypothetical protein